MRTQKHPLQYESLSSKLVAIPGLLVTTVLALLLLVASVRGSTFTGNIVQTVPKNRDSIAFAVQVISTFLGMLDVFALQSTINLSARIFWEHRTFSLYTFELISALNEFKVSLSLPWQFVPLLLILYGAAKFPAALWAGAITPIVVPKTSTGTIELAAWTNTTFLTGNTHPALPNPKDTFEYQPQYRHQGLLLSSASTASLRQNGSVIHAKLDHTGYFYQSRSYGVGASVGLVDDELASNATQYQFYEIGLDPRVSCIYNSSTNISIGPAQGVSGDDLNASDLALFSITGTLPNNAAVSAVGASILGETVLYAAATSIERQAYVAFATGDSKHNFYHYLYQAQCRVDFSPRNYSVSVDVSDSTIHVEPVVQDQEPAWPANGTALVTHSIETINSISYILATALGTSPFGNAFVNNILANGIDTSDQSNAQILGAIADSVASLIDNSLIILNSAQLMIAQETVSTPVLISTPAIAFGTSTYIEVLVAVHFFTCLVFLVELVRTRCWHRLTSFKFTDPTELIAAASGGSTNLYEAADKSIKGNDNFHEQAGKLRVRLNHGRHDEIPILELEGSRTSAFTDDHQPVNDEDDRESQSIPLRESIATMGRTPSSTGTSFVDG